MGTIPAPDGGANPFDWARIQAAAAQNATSQLRANTNSMRQDLFNAELGRQNSIYNLGINSQERQNTAEQNDFNGLGPSRIGMLRGTGGGSSAIGIDQVPQQYRQLVKDAADKEGVDANLLASLLHQESGFRPNATGPQTRYGRAKGMAQLIDGTAAQLGVNNPYDPAQAIPAAARYLAGNLRKFGGNTAAALAAYNWGPDNAAKWLAAGADPMRLPAETRNYIRSITGGRNTALVQKKLNGDTSAAAAGADGTDAEELVPIPNYTFTHNPKLVSDYEPVVGKLNARGMQLYRKKAKQDAAAAQSLSGNATPSTPVTGATVQPNPVAQSAAVPEVIDQPVSADGNDPAADPSIATAPVKLGVPASAQPVGSGAPAPDLSKFYIKRKPDGSTMIIDKATGEVLAEK